LPQGAQGLNKLVAMVRVRAEHASAGIKRLRCLTDVYGNRRTAMEDRVMVVDGGRIALPVREGGAGLPTGAEAGNTESDAQNRAHS